MRSAAVSPIGSAPAAADSICTITSWAAPANTTIEVSWASHTGMPAATAPMPYSMPKGITPSCSGASSRQPARNSFRRRPTAQNFSTGPLPPPAPAPSASPLGSSTSPVWSKSMPPKLPVTRRPLRR